MKNIKGKYEKPEMEIISIEVNDIIFASGGDPGDGSGCVGECP